VNFTPSIPQELVTAALPIFILSIGSLIAMLQAVFPKIGGLGATKGVFFVSLILAMASIGIPSPDMPFFEGAYLAESLSKFGFILLLVIAVIVGIFYSQSYQEKHFFRGEVTSLFLLVTLGAMVLVASDEMVSLFIGFELSSIGLYALVGYIKPNRLSMEGAVKYFVLGSFAAGFLLFGFGLLYASTGSMRISEVINQAATLGQHPWMQVGAIFTLVGIGFKLALVPFHLWGPDAYEGSSTGLTAYMATAVKTMMLILTLRFMAYGFYELKQIWMPMLTALAGLSMIVGNIMGLVQSSIKRMLAYSSIAHSGYMAIAICAIGIQSGEAPIEAILFYLIGYTVISLAAFGILMWLENDVAENLQLDDLAGLAKTHPWAAFSLALLMFAFAGFPPTIGFISKFFVFRAALESGLYGLVIVGAIGSMIAMYYYLRIPVKMYMTKPNPTLVGQLHPQKSYVLGAVVAVSIAVIILGGTIFPDDMLSWLGQASQDILTTH
jgi:NADH-quinone oxidoreductase subunit N